MSTPMIDSAEYEPGSLERWSARVTVRLQAEYPVALETREGDEFRLGPGGSASFRARVGELPWPLPEGFHPLALLLLDGAGITWTWELPVVLPLPTRP